jgi:hypothetical protein
VPGSSNNAADRYAEGSDKASQSPSLSNTPFRPQSDAPFPVAQPIGLTSGNSDQFTPPAHPPYLAPLDGSSWLGSVNRYPIDPIGPIGWDRLQLAQERESIEQEDILDTIAPVRTQIYIASRQDLQRIQPNNYALTVPSLRTPGGAPTKEEIGSLKLAFRVAQSTQPFADMASRISGLIDSRAQQHRTIAVLQTSRGTFIAGSGERPLEPAQVDAIQDARATQIERAGVDAEIAALENAEGLPQFIAASRPFCPSCRIAIEGKGGDITSPTTAVFPRNIPSLAFPSTKSILQ